MVELDSLMSDKNYWQLWEDRRGNCLTSITRTWNAQGRFHPGKDALHPTELGGKREAVLAEAHQDRLNQLLKGLGEQLTPIIQSKRPDVYELLREYDVLQSDYGLFPLFMVAMCTTIPMISSQLWWGLIPHPTQVFFFSHTSPYPLRPISCHNPVIRICDGNQPKLVCPQQPFHFQ
jgi:hypothetical protein